MLRGLFGLFSDFPFSLPCLGPRLGSWHPSRVLDFKSPYEKLYSHPPSLSHLKVFGCLSYAVYPRVLDKFTSRAIPIVFMGYSSTQKGYLLYDIHVVFHEYLFPFKHLQASSNPMFLVHDPAHSNFESPSPSSISRSTPMTSIQSPTPPSLVAYPKAPLKTHLFLWCSILLLIYLKDQPGPGDLIYGNKTLSLSLKALHVPTLWLTNSVTLTVFFL